MKKISQMKPKMAALIIFLVLMACVPIFITNTYILKVLNNVMLYAVIALSVNLILGFCGLLDFGRSAFVGIGTYSFALLMTHVTNIPWFVGFIAAALFTALLGWLVGCFLRRTSFDYLTLLTIGIVEIVRLFLVNCTSITNGAMGITGVPEPSFFGFELNSHGKFFYFSLILLVVCYLLINRLINSYKGRALMAIRDDEIAAAFSAINIPKYKAFCLGIASFFTGLGGAAMVSYTGYASPYNFTIDEGLILCQMAILGGLGSLPGSILGAVILVVVPELSRTAYEYRLLIMGIMMVVLMLFCPNGLLGKNGLKDILVKKAKQILKHEGKPEEERRAAK